MFVSSIEQLHHHHHRQHSRVESLSQASNQAPSRDPPLVPFRDISLVLLGPSIRNYTRRWSVGPAVSRIGSYESRRDPRREEEGGSNGHLQHTSGQSIRGGIEQNKRKEKSEIWTWYVSYNHATVAMACPNLEFRIMIQRAKEEVSNNLGRKREKKEKKRTILARQPAQEEAPSAAAAGFPSSMRRGSTFQMPSAYSQMQRSELKKPMRATLVMHFVIQPSRSR